MPHLSIRLLGDFAIYKDGELQPLPGSRKTRAVLAYLLVCGRAQRRDRLIELFWTVPDDPKGALRWSLSKIRSLMNTPEKVAVQADRERVFIDNARMTLDLTEATQALANPDLDFVTLHETLDTLTTQTLMDGLELPDQMEFSLWLESERTRIRALVEHHLPRLFEHPDMSPDAGLAMARRWLERSPYSVNGANAVLFSLLRMKRDAEYVREKSRFMTYFHDAEMEFTPVSAKQKGELAFPRQEDPSPPGRPGPADPPPPQQDIRFCRTFDNVSIAYATVGSGPPLVKAANWLSHLELDWDAPIWSPLFRELSREHTFIRYDERGNGLSDWDVKDISQAAFVADLEAVVDSLGLETFPLLGISQGAAVSIEYAVRHPERVSRLILFGGYSAGWRKHATPAQADEREAIITLVRAGWGSENPAYRRIFSTTFMPEASAEQLHWFDDFQRQTTSPDNAARFLSAFGDIDVEELLPQIRVPTLILHSRRDQRIEWHTAREMASWIPNARLVTLESANHLLLEGEPASKTFLSAIREFLSEEG